MPTSHHRKKHKHPGQQFEHPGGPRKKRTAAKVMAVVGGLIGFAITYFATDQNWLWIIPGMIVGVLLGYTFGRNIDKTAGNM